MNQDYIYPIKTLEDKYFIPVDDWIAQPNEAIWKTAKGVIILPCAELLNIRNTDINYFDMTQKRCYNSDDVRFHIVHYLNYFSRFYDDGMLIQTYVRIKYMIDLVESYDIDAFFNDINKYILHGEIANRIRFMDMQNYKLSISSYKHGKNPSLQYTDEHASILYQVSMFMIAIIPLLTHFAKVKKIGIVKVKNIDTIDDFLLSAYDLILDLYPNVDIISKLYETVTTTVNTRVPKDQVLWDQQDIRGINPRTQSIDTIRNILLNIIPKYVYNRNIVTLNFASITRNIGYQVVNIDYGMDFTNLSSSNRDEDNNSEFDRFESYHIKRDEATYIMNKVNCEETMRSIEKAYGPFDKAEIDYFIQKNTNENGSFKMNPFLRNIVFNLYYKNFGDPESIKAINKEDYIKLMITAKRMLQANNMVVMPYIVSSNAVRINQRKNLNKKELTKLKSSPLFKEIQKKYKDPKIEAEIIQLIATILSSEFHIISYNEPDLDGRKIVMIPDMIMEEVCMLVLAI